MEYFGFGFINLFSGHFTKNVFTYLNSNFRTTFSSQVHAGQLYSASAPGTRFIKGSDTPPEQDRQDKITVCLMN